MDFTNPKIETKKKLRNLLLKSILSDGEDSINSFVEWEKQIVFDDLDFQSFKLLPAVYLKLPENFESRLKLRIKGAYRRSWTENQLLLNSLKTLFSALKSAKIEFIIADENIRLIEIYNDTGIYSLQNFSIAAPISSKKEFAQILSENCWESCKEELESTKFKQDKALNINILWLNDKEFAAQSKDKELVLVDNELQPIVCAEEQILNLCEEEFLISGDEKNRYQFIVSKIFQTQNIDAQKLILLAQRRRSAHPLAQMLEKLENDFAIKISIELLNNLQQSKRTGRIFSIKQKIETLKNSYRIYAESEKQSGANPKFLEFLAKRWKIESNKVLLKHAVKSGIRLLQAK